MIEITEQRLDAWEYILAETPGLNHDGAHALIALARRGLQAQRDAQDWAIEQEILDTPFVVAPSSDEHTRAVAEQHPGKWWAESILSLLGRIGTAEAQRDRYKAALEGIRRDLDDIDRGEILPDGDFVNVPTALWAERWVEKIDTEIARKALGEEEK